MLYTNFAEIHYKRNDDDKYSNIKQKKFFHFLTRTVFKIATVCTMLHLCTQCMKKIPRYRDI